MPDEVRERPRFQARLREEIARSERYGHPFVLVLFEAHRGNDVVPLRSRMTSGLDILRRSLRSADLAYKVFEDVLVALLVETDLSGAREAVHRLRQHLNLYAGSWEMTAYSYPQQSEEIQSLTVLSAA